MGYSALRSAQHLNGPIAMSVRREFVLMSVVFFSRTPLQSLCLASACKWLASRHSVGEVGVSARLFSCGEEDCVLAPLRSVRRPVRSVSLRMPLVVVACGGCPVRVRKKCVACVVSCLMSW